MLEAPKEAQPGKVRRARVYSLKPGMAHIYNEGDVHSPKRTATTGLIRIEGKNTHKMKRLPYKAVYSSVFREVKSRRSEVCLRNLEP